MGALLTSLSKEYSPDSSSDSSFNLLSLLKVHLLHTTVTSVGVPLSLCVPHVWSQEALRFLRAPVQTLGPLMGTLTLPRSLQTSGLFYFLKTANTELS